MLNFGPDNRLVDESESRDGFSDTKPTASMLPWVVGVFALAVLLTYFIFPEDKPQPVVAMPEPTVQPPKPAAKTEPSSSIVRPASVPLPAVTSAPKPPPVTVPAPEPQPVAKPEPVAPKPAPQTADTKVETTPGSRARAIIAEFRNQEEAVDLYEIFTSAEQLKEEGMLTDAHLLYFYAARKGHGSSALALAKMHDPDYHSQQTSIMEKPDLIQAYKWYLQAADSGNVMAKAHLNDLRTRVELAASKGDAAAERLLLQWR